MSGGFQTRPIGENGPVFAAAPHNRRAPIDGLLDASLLAQHCTVAVADTSRILPRMAAGLLNGRDTLTAPSLQAKLAAQIAGPECGHLPRMLAVGHLTSGTLIEKPRASQNQMVPSILHGAVRCTARALKWFTQPLAEPATKTELWR